MSENLYDRLLRAALAMTRQCWEQGMLSYALMKCGEDALLGLVCRDMVARQSADGRLCNVENTPAVTDSAFCVPAVWALGGKDPSFRAAALRNVDFLLNDAGRADDGTLFHMRGTGEIWADSAAFLPYSLAITGHGEAACRQMAGILERLYLPECGLYAHVWDERARAYPDRRPWGVGNGWILTGLLRTALTLEGAARADLLGRFRALLETMLARMTPEGGFHDDLVDPATFLEAETAAMTALCIRAGIDAGVLDAELLPAARRIRRGVLERVDAMGVIQGASGSPRFDRPGASVECQAHAMMLERLFDWGE